VDFFNLNWNETDVYDSNYNCSDIFDFDLGSDSTYHLDDLSCSGQDKSTDSALKTRIKISSNNEELLLKITKEKIKVTLKDELFT